MPIIFEVCLWDIIFDTLNSFKGKYLNCYSKVEVFSNKYFSFIKADFINAYMTPKLCFSYFGHIVKHGKKAHLESFRIFSLFCFISNI